MKKRKITGIFVIIVLIALFIKKNYFKDDRIDVVGTDAHLYFYILLFNDDKDKFDEIINEAKEHNVSEKVIAYAMYTIGELKFMTENYNEAIYYYSMAIKQRETPTYYYARLLSYLKIGEREKALSDLKKIEKLSHKFI
jgi:tetratricopeptide (TPR) repeat protein